MAACWRSVTPYVIQLHRPSVPVAPVLGIQGVIKMAVEEFYWREAVYPPYFDFSEEKFMFKRTWQVVFWGARNYFRHPKTTCRSPEGSGRAPLRSRCAWKRKIKNKNLKNDHNNIYSLSLKKWPLLKRVWTLFVFPIYLSSYFLILRYSVAGFIFCNRAACSRCPLHICRAFMMDSFSAFSSFNGNMTGAITSFTRSVLIASI